ncbi:MAG: MogA/MoaB family molybdenum cofactor biosynthesis protein [Nitrososphaeria archaeon]
MERKLGLKFGIITISTSRFYNEQKPDESGLLASAMIRNYGFKVCCRFLVPDDRTAIAGALGQSVFNFKADVAVLIGGTGPSRTDYTDEVVRKLADKVIEGPGEEFRRRSYERLGARGLLGNMTVALLGDSVIVSLPGSRDAVEEGLKIFMESIEHIISVRRGSGHDA